MRKRGTTSLKEKKERKEKTRKSSSNFVLLPPERLSSIKNRSPQRSRFN